MEKAYILINKERVFTNLLLITYPHGVCFFIANTRYSSFNQNHKMSWTLEKETKLKELWKKGHTASQIAAVLGDGTTRNAVIGKAHRLNLEGRAVFKKIKTKTNNNSQSEVKTQKLGRKASFKALLLSSDFEQENPTRLQNLTDKHCRWPLGEKLQPASFFCGRKPVEKFPYCQLHLLWGYQSRNEKEEDIITEEDIPKFIEKKIKSA